MNIPPVSKLIEETDGYTMRQKRDKERVKKTYTLFIYNLKIYQENHQNLEIVNEMIVKASMETGACYGLKKCAEIGCFGRKNVCVRPKQK